MVNVANGLREVGRRLERAGHDVIFVSGWQSRGAGSMRGVRGMVKHHTAGASSGEAPSLRVVTFGRAGLRNSLSHFLRGREWQGRKPRLWIVAAEVCWHAGNSRWHGTSSLNYYYLGDEEESVGTSREPWKSSELELSADLDVVCADVFNYDVGVVTAEHKEVAIPSGRKVDRHSISGPSWRRRVRSHAVGTPQPKPEPKPEDEEVMKRSSKVRGDGAGAVARELCDDWLDAYNGFRRANGWSKSSWQRLGVKDVVDTATVNRVQSICRMTRPATVPNPGDNSEIHLSLLSLVAFEAARLRQATGSIKRQEQDEEAVRLINELRAKVEAAE